MVAINSLVMLFLYGPLGGLLLDVNAMPVPWQTMLLSVSIYGDRIVQRDIFTLAYPDKHNRPAVDISSAVLVQGRGHHGQPTYDFVDCHSTFHTNDCYLRHRLFCTRAVVETLLP